jgi:hypothetical protein
MFWRECFRPPSGVKWTEVKVSLRPTLCHPLRLAVEILARLVAVYYIQP